MAVIKRDSRADSIEIDQPEDGVTDEQRNGENGDDLHAVQAGYVAKLFIECHVGSDDRLTSTDHLSGNGPAHHDWFELDPHNGSMRRR